MLTYEKYFQSSSARADVSRLRDVVEESAAIFPLTDTRKSRWLPTMMARALGKTLVNVSLGLDGWPVIRNGVSRCASNCLGCYFCIPQELHA